MKKILVKIAATLFPNWIANFAYDQLTNPQVKKLRPHELEILKKAQKDLLAFKGFTIQLYRWGSGKQSVLLVHGWEGQAGNFADLIEVLVANNYSVYAFDAPSHGYSSKGSTSLFEFTELVGVLIRKHGITNLVSHSFGGVATTFALYENQDLSLEKYVLLTTPDKFSERIDDVCKQTGIPLKVKNRLLNRLKSEMNMDIETTNVSHFVKYINVTYPLIIHDKNDRVIPIERSKNVQKNWGNCEFIEIEGTGHFRILRTPFVLERTLKFLQQ